MSLVCTSVHRELGGIPRARIHLDGGSPGIGEPVEELETLGEGWVVVERSESYIVAIPSWGLHLTQPGLHIVGDGVRLGGLDQVFPGLHGVEKITSQCPTVCTSHEGPPLRLLQALLGSACLLASPEAGRMTVFAPQRDDPHELDRRRFRALPRVTEYMVPARAASAFCISEGRYVRVGDGPALHFGVCNTRAQLERLAKALESWRRWGAWRATVEFDVEVDEEPSLIGKIVRIDRLKGRVWRERWRLLDSGSMTATLELRDPEAGFQPGTHKQGALLTGTVLSERNGPPACIRVQIHGTGAAVWAAVPVPAMKVNKFWCPPVAGEVVELRTRAHGLAPAVIERVFVDHPDDPERLARGSDGVLLSRAGTDVVVGADGLEIATKDQASIAIGKTMQVNIPTKFKEQVDVE